ncbi:MAG TPA: superoxide dismutase family protein [Gemmatimonadales bacterium]|nr:superoxide dismutase family protein [Gemmatimonadales bacterium]
MRSVVLAAVRCLVLAAVVPAAGCAGGGRSSEARVVAAGVRADVIDTTGASIGGASLLDSRSGTVLVLKLKRVPPGTHGLHVHETGACDPPAFTSAGPHLNPSNRKHGARNPDGPHAGDLPNVHARPDSTVDTTLTLRGELLGPGVLGAGAPPRALVLHANADDLVTDPSGNSGARIACGILRR